MRAEKVATEEDDFDDMITGSDEEIEVKDTRSAVSHDAEARRKLEDRLEMRRLEKLIQDYDFDLD